MNYPEGSYIRSGSNSFSRVLGAVGRLRFISEYWLKGGKECDSPIDHPYLAEHLERDGHIEVSPEEATGRKEEWIPERGKEYWYPDITEGESNNFIWDNDETDKTILGSVGVFRTKEESDARLARILEAIKNIE